MKEAICGNFQFISNIHPEVYTKLNTAEQQARTNFRASGHETRKALEKMVGSMIDKYNLGRTIPKNLELSKKIGMLRYETIAGKPILPDIGTVKFKYEDGRTEEADYYDFMRKFGNTCSHSDKRFNDVEVSYKNVIKCLKGYHLFLKKYCASRIPKDTPSFDENIMPIEEYYIYESYVPEDSQRSKCVKEFLGYTQDNNGDKAFYAILRLYNKEDLNEQFILRNTDTFIEASKMSISSVPEGMTRMRELIPYSGTSSTFYIISYIFNRKPHQLTEAMIKDMAFQKRIKMCKRISDCFANLHQSEVPIYHRMLSYESIYVCDYGREWVSYVVKFDFAKIETGDPARTVLTDAIKAKAKVQELKQLKYLAPEWMATSHSDHVNWGRMDIYSLGILFSDILSGNIGVTPASIEELEDLDLSDDILDMLDAMRADSPEERLDIEEVQMILEEEIRQWR